MKHAKIKKEPGHKPDDGQATVEVDGLDSLAKLALDLQSSWNHRTDELWDSSIPCSGAHAQSWGLLQTVSPRPAEARPFRSRLPGDGRCLVQSGGDAAAPAWFQRKHPQSALSCVAYFSMEFHAERIAAIYSEVSAMLPGDQLKAASDLGVPWSALDCSTSRAISRQSIARTDRNRRTIPTNDPGQLPITPLRQPNGEWLRLEIALPGLFGLAAGVQAQVGEQALPPGQQRRGKRALQRGITSQLYGGGPELAPSAGDPSRNRGLAAVGCRGIRTRSLHLNEGHAAFAVLERARSFMVDTGPILRGCAGRYPGWQSLHHPHGGACRLRSFRTRPHRTLLRGYVEEN